MASATTPATLHSRYLFLAGLERYLLLLSKQGVGTNFC